MKKLLFIFATIALLSCSKDDEVNAPTIPVADCYECSAIKDTQYGTLKTCGSEQDLKKFKERMEAQGYNIIECHLDN